MDPDEPVAPEQEAPPADASVAPAVESAPPEPAAPDVVAAPASSEESEPEVSPVSPSNIEITNEPEEPPVSSPNIDIANQLEPEVAGAFAPAAPLTLPAFNPRSADELNFLRMVLGPKAWASHRARTAARLEKIVALAREKGTIDRKMVRLHLNVSQAPATRYLTALVKQGRLARQKAGHDWVYRVVG